MICSLTSPQNFMNLYCHLHFSPLHKWKHYFRGLCGFLLTRDFIISPLLQARWESFQSGLYTELAQPSLSSPPKKGGLFVGERKMRLRSSTWISPLFKCHTVPLGPQRAQTLALRVILLLSFGILSSSWMCPSWKTNVENRRIFICLPCLLLKRCTSV